MQTLCCKVFLYGNKRENIIVESMLNRFRFALIIICLAFIGKVSAQFDDPKTLEVGFHGGLSYYIGDLNPTKHFAMPDMQFGGVVRFNANPRWTFRADYTQAVVKATDKKIGWRPERNLGFRTVINDLSLIAEFNFFEYYTGTPKRNCSPYIFGGVSVFHYTPRFYAADTIGVALRPLNTEALDKPYGFNAFGLSLPLGISIPFGVGVKLALSKRVAATFEWRMHKTFTDYIDDCGTIYPDQAHHAVVDGFDYTDPSGNYLPNQQRGDSAYKDSYGIVGASFTWKFNMPDGRRCNLSNF